LPVVSNCRFCATSQVRLVAQNRQWWRRTGDLLTTFAVCSCRHGMRVSDCTGVLSGAQAFSNYTCTLSACTAGGCTESPASTTVSTLEQRMSVNYFKPYIILLDAIFILSSCHVYRAALTSVPYHRFFLKCKFSYFRYFLISLKLLLDNGKFSSACR